MPDVLHRTTLEYRSSVSLGYHSVALWIHVPDLSAVATGGSGHWEFDVSRKYWNVAGDAISEKTQTEKDQVDADELAAAKIVRESQVKANIVADPLEGSAVTAVATGLSITVNINTMLVVNDITTVVADSSDIKFVMLCYVYNTTTDQLAVKAYEKTTGLYAALADDEQLVRHLGEWSVPANGTELTEV